MFPISQDGGFLLTNAENLAVDPVTVVRRQESNNTGDIDGLADTVVWGPRSSVLVDLVVGHLVTTRDVLLAHGVVHVGLDTARGNAVDGDLLLTSVCFRALADQSRHWKGGSDERTNGHAAHKGLNGTLAARVEGVLWHALGLARDAAHQDDAAVGLHALVSLLGDEELTTGVDVEDTVELLGSDVLEVAEGNDTGVGAADVELAEVVNGLLHELSGLLGVGNVGHDGDGVGAEILDLLDDLLSGLGAVGVVHDDLGAAASELHGHGLADTTTCTACQ